MTLNHFFVKLQIQRRPQSSTNSSTNHCWRRDSSRIIADAPDLHSGDQHRTLSTVVTQFFTNRSKCYEKRRFVLGVASKTSGVRASKSKESLRIVRSANPISAAPRDQIRLTKMRR